MRFQDAIVKIGEGNNEALAIMAKVVNATGVTSGPNGDKDGCSLVLNTLLKHDIKGYRVYELWRLTKGNSEEFIGVCLLLNAGRMTHDYIVQVLTGKRAINHELIREELLKLAEDKLPMEKES